MFWRVGVVLIGEAEGAEVWSLRSFEVFWLRLELGSMVFGLLRFTL